MKTLCNYFILVRDHHRCKSTVPESGQESGMSDYESNILAITLVRLRLATHRTWTLNDTAPLSDIEFCRPQTFERTGSTAPGWERTYLSVTRPLRKRSTERCYLIFWSSRFDVNCPDDMNICMHVYVITGTQIYQAPKLFWASSTINEWLDKASE